MTAEIKDSRISTNVTKLTKVDVENTAKQLNIKPAELLREAVEAYLSQADVHAQLKRAINEYNQLAEKSRLAKIQIDDLEAECRDEKAKAEALEQEKELLQAECQKFSETTTKQRNEIANLQSGLAESQADLEAYNNRGIFRRLFNLKPKQPKPEKRTWDTPSKPITPTPKTE